MTTTRERIQEAAHRLAAHRPVSELSFAQIAKEAGVSWATVRRYVGEKDHLEEFLAKAPASSSSVQTSDTRNRILAAARRVFAAYGYTGASLDEVAADAGLTKGAIYWYFASKSEVLLALVEERRERQAQTLPEAIRRFTSSDDPVSALTAVLAEQMELCRHNQEWPRLVVEFLSESRDPVVRERFLLLTRRRQEIIRDAIAEAQRLCCKKWPRRTERDVMVPHNRSQAATPKSVAIKATCPLTSPLSAPCSCPFLIQFMIS